MDDVREFIAIFKAEAEDQLSKLDRGLVELEKHPDSPDLVKELNRAAHTLKGSSRVMGYMPIQEIAHRIEDIFDKILQKKLIFNSGIAEKIFKGIDAIRLILSKVVNNEKNEIDISVICENLEKASTGLMESQKPVQEEAQAVLPKAQSSFTTDDSFSQEYIRVPVARVNKLLNLAGEMVINKMKSSQKITQLKKLFRLAKDVQKNMAEFSEQVKSIIPVAEIDTINLMGQCLAGIERLREDTLKLYDDISSEVFHLDPVVDELQDKMKEMRMLPCSTIFEGFPRMLRDIASQEYKEINLEISGAQTELDRKVLEMIKSPMMHILRNCIDHGIEEPEKRKSTGKNAAGTIKIRAYHETGNVLIIVEDDGQGMDIEEIKKTVFAKDLVKAEELACMSEKEILNLIFMNGYSTSPIITDVSGRGIGLDVVRRDIENLKGQVVVETQKGLGTKFTLVLPLTVAIIKTLLIESEAMFFAISLASVEETLTISVNDVSTVDGRMAMQIHGKLVPLVKLNEVLSLPSAPKEDVEEDIAPKEYNVVVVSSLDKWIGFIVDNILGEEEMFIKGLGEHLGRVRNVSGASILGHGEVVVILDAADLVDQSCLGHPAASRRRDARKQKSGKKILIVEDTLTIRELEKSILEAQGYEVDISVDGLDALNKLAEKHYDLVVSDVQMPRMDGFELCMTIKKSDEYRNLPVVIVTALEKEEDRRRGIEAGAQAYIVKRAFDQSSLLDTIERLIGV